MHTVLLNRKVWLRNSALLGFTDDGKQWFGQPKEGTVVAVHVDGKHLYLTVAFDNAPLLTHHSDFFELRPIGPVWQSASDAPTVPPCQSSPSSSAISSPTSTGSSPSAPK